MQRFAYFHGYVVTTNPDGSIPLNAKVVAEKVIAFDNKLKDPVAIEAAVLVALLNGCNPGVLQQLKIG